MSRSSRQSKILEIISQRNIETQDELVDALRRSGYDVTQATISRDIKELGLLKTQDANGNYRYVTQQRVEKLSSKLLNILKEAVISVVTAENLVVVKTIGFSAATVSGAVEQLDLDNVLGVLADKSTVLIVTPTRLTAKEVAQKITEYV